MTWFKEGPQYEFIYSFTTISIYTGLFQNNRRVSWPLLHFSLRVFKSFAAIRPQPWFLELHSRNPEDSAAGFSFCPVRTETELYKEGSS